MLEEVLKILIIIKAQGFLPVMTRTEKERNNFPIMGFNVSLAIRKQSQQSI